MEVSTQEIIPSPELEARMEREWSYPRSLSVTLLPSSPIIEGVTENWLNRGSGRGSSGRHGEGQLRSKEGGRGEQIRLRKGVE